MKGNNVSEHPVRLYTVGSSGNVESLRARLDINSPESNPGVKGWERRGRGGNRTHYLIYTEQRRKRVKLSRVLSCPHPFRTAGHTICSTKWWRLHFCFMAERKGNLSHIIKDMFFCLSHCITLGMLHVKKTIIYSLNILIWKKKNETLLLEVMQSNYYFKTVPK
jgi:hypothetical protein